MFVCVCMPSTTKQCLLFCWWRGWYCIVCVYQKRAYHALLHTLVPHSRVISHGTSSSLPRWMSAHQVMHHTTLHTERCEAHASPTVRALCKRHNASACAWLRDKWFRHYFHLMLFDSIVWARALRRPFPAASIWYTFYIFLHSIYQPTTIAPPHPA